MCQETQDIKIEHDIDCITSNIFFPEMQLNVVTELVRLGMRNIATLTLYQCQVLVAIHHR
jgi:hypothetical protein